MDLFGRKTQKASLHLLRTRL